MTSDSWHDGLLLGHPSMDEEHEVFMRLTDALQHAADAELPAALDALAAHATLHFDNENRWMRDSAFPSADCHQDEHNAVLKSVTEVQALLAQGHSAIVRDLAAELAAWFPAHVQHLDSALSHWLCKQQHGGKPIVIRRHIAPHTTVGSGQVS